jgi:serine/threonine-protein kinase
MALAAGTRLGPYEILAPLGAGGMGEVYRGYDRRLSRDVAIKVLAERLAHDRVHRARFEREAKAVAAVSHPNILSIHDFAEEDGVFFTVTELLEGQTLANRLRRERLPWRKAVEIGIAIGDGLGAAHGRGIAHRDLKPENIFLTEDGLVKILDFGLARVGGFGAGGQGKTRTWSVQTEAGALIGTVGYMSPEQVSGETADARSDIFSLGCVLFEMLTGRRAFECASAGETLAAILRDPPAEITESGGMPVALDRIVRRCLEKRPEDRFQTARDLGFALKEVFEGRSESGSEPISSGSRRAALESMAVLPFENLSGDPDAEYLSDGIAESILYSLSKLPRLRVMARSTISRYKGKGADPRRVSRDLGVRAVLTGRVFHRGESLVVKTELVDGRDGSQIWGESYSRTLSDILALEEEIAREISGKLRVAVTGEEAAHLIRRETENTEAYRLYLLGRFFLEKRTAESFHKAIEYFRQAIDQDPEYALAYAGTASCYNMLGFYCELSPAQAFSKAKAAAARALERDATLGDARAAMGYACFYYDWDWIQAESEYRRAIEDSPSNANTRQFYAVFLSAMGRQEEALAEVARAETLDPLSLPIQATLGWCRYLARRFDESIAGVEAAIQMDPGFAPFRHALAWPLIARGKFAEAIEQLSRAVALSARTPFYLATLGLAHAAAGSRTEAKEILRELEDIRKKRYMSSYQLALIPFALGEPDRGFELLETALQERDWCLALLGVDPRIDPARSDPRFAEMLRRVGLPGSQATGEPKRS